MEIKIPNNFTYYAVGVFPINSFLKFYHRKSICIYAKWHILKKIVKNIYAERPILPVFYRIFLENRHKIIFTHLCNLRRFICNDFSSNIRICVK